MDAMQLPTKQPKDRKAAKPASQKGKHDSAFDTWLERGLHQLYDDVAREPVPEELLRLIEEDRKK